MKTFQVQLLDEKGKNYGLLNVDSTLRFKDMLFCCRKTYDKKMLLSPSIFPNDRCRTTGRVVLVMKSIYNRLHPVIIYESGGVFSRTPSLKNLQKNVTAIVIVSQTAEQIDYLKKFHETLQSLSFISIVCDEGKFNSLTKLTYLCLNRCHQHVNFEKLKNLVCLKHIDFSGSRLCSSLNNIPFEDWVNLEKVILKHCYAKTKLLSASIWRLRKLVYLDISGNDVDYLNFPDDTSVVPLEYLNIFNTSIRNDDSSSSHLGKLKRLSSMSNSFKRFDFTKLEHLKVICSSIEFLKILDCSKFLKKFSAIMNFNSYVFVGECVSIFENNFVIKDILFYNVRLCEEVKEMIRTIINRNNTQYQMKKEASFHVLLCCKISTLLCKDVARIVAFKIYSFEGDFGNVYY